VVAAGRFRLRVVLMCLLYRLVCCLVGALARGGGQRELEIVVLRHQLAILRRGGKRPRYTTVDRALLAAARRLLPPERWSCFAVSPQTLRRWHRALLEGGRRRRRRRPGRPPLAAETRALIRRLARENPRWGYMRIEGELLKLGISVSATTIATVLRSSGLGPGPRRIGPSWSEFLRAQALSMLGGSPSSAAGDDTLADDASEPNGSPQLGPDRKIEAADHFSAAGAVELRSASHPASNHLAPPRPRVSPRPEVPLRLPPSHRSHARDGPQRAGPRSSHTKCSGATSKPSRPVPRFAANHASDPLARPRGSSAPRRRRNRSTSSPSRTPTRVSLPHRVLDEWCARIRRDPGEIVRSVLMLDKELVERADEFLEAGLPTCSWPFEARP
jgi:hypothetical protein